MNWQRVDRPIELAMRFQQPVFLQVGELLGNLGLGQFERGLHVTDAEGASLKQMEDAQTRFVAEAFVGRNAVHATNIQVGEYRVNGLLVGEGPYFRVNSPSTRRIRLRGLPSFNSSGSWL